MLPGEAELDISRSAPGFNAFRQLGPGSASQPRGGACGEEQSGTLALLSSYWGLGECLGTPGSQGSLSKVLHPASCLQLPETPHSLQQRSGGVLGGAGTRWPEGSCG